MYDEFGEIELLFDWILVDVGVLDFGVRDEDVRVLEYVLVNFEF